VRGRRCDANLLERKVLLGLLRFLQELHPRIWLLSSTSCTSAARFAPAALACGFTSAASSRRCTRDRLDAELRKIAEDLRGEVDWEVG